MKEIRMSDPKIAPFFFFFFLVIGGIPEKHYGMVVLVLYTKIFEMSFKNQLCVRHEQIGPLLCAAVKSMHLKDYKSKMRKRPFLCSSVFFKDANWR